MKDATLRLRTTALYLVTMTTAAAAASSVSSCVEGGEPAPTARSSAVGEPANGFPSPAERLGLMAINRARSDPQTVKGSGSASYPARPPVIFSEPLARSARFHATSLETADVTLMHASPCALKTDVATSGCNGDPSCACATPVPSTCANCASPAADSCGTAPFTRIGYFTAGTGVSASGEVAAAGYSTPMATVDGWMNEASGSDGHRRILTDQGSSANTMGYGHAAGANCWATFDVGDSGTLSGAVIPKIPTAAVSPSTGAAGTFTFYATWADATSGAPSSLSVVVDGACTSMTRELGTDTLNATYKVTSSLAAGCHTYFIAATDAAGVAVTYPTTGALTVSVGNVACASEYVTPAPAATCSTGAGGAGGGVASGGRGGGAAGGTTGNGGSSASGGAVGAGGRAASGGATATGGTTPTGGGGAGGSAGRSSSGGASGSGGLPGTGGAGATGSAGARGSGGMTMGAGGRTAASGGASSTGGATSTGGNVPGSGGRSGAAGAPVSPGSGGASSTGGATSTGGNLPGSGGRSGATGSGGGSVSAGSGGRTTGSGGAGSTGHPGVTGGDNIVGAGCACEVTSGAASSQTIGGLSSLVLLALAPILPQRRRRSRPRR